MKEQNDNKVKTFLIPMDNGYFTLHNNRVGTALDVAYHPTQFTAQYLPNKAFFSTVLLMSSQVDGEDLVHHIETRAYEELGLDYASSYKIDFFELESENKVHRKFYIFAILEEHLNTYIASFKKQVKYIDLVLPTPLLYGVLYHKRVLHKTGMDVFIYLETVDATVSFYKNGRFIYAKSLSYSLEDIYEIYSQKAEYAITKERFFEYLFSSKIKEVSQLNQEIVLEIFKAFLSVLNDVVVFVKRTYDFEMPNQIFFDTSKGFIKELYGLMQIQFHVEVSPFNFKHTLDTSQNKYSHFETLLFLNAMEYIQHDYKLCNISPIQRPPLFYKRTSGRFLLALSATFVLSSLVPLWYIVNSMVFKAQALQHKNTITPLEKEMLHIKSFLANKQEKIEALEKTQHILHAEVKQKTAQLKAVYDKRVNYIFKSKLLQIVAMELNRFTLKVTKIKSTKNRLSLWLVGSSSRVFTFFVESLLEKYETHLQNIELHDIKKDATKSYYVAKIEVMFK